MLSSAILVVSSPDISKSTFVWCLYCCMHKRHERMAFLDWEVRKAAGYQGADGEMAINCSRRGSYKQNLPAQYGLLFWEITHVDKGEAVIHPGIISAEPVSSVSILASSSPIWSMEARSWQQI